MGKIQFGPFKGEAPRVAPHQLPAGMAQLSLNANLMRGMLEPLNDVSLVRGMGAACQTIFKHSSGVWLGFTSPVSVVEGVVAADTSGRVFWADGVYPKQSSSSMLAAFGSWVDPGSHYRLGVPAPGAHPAVGIASDVPSEFSTTRTYVYAWIHRGTLGAKSANITVTLAPGQSAHLYDLDDTPPTVYPTGGASAKANSFRKHLYELDSVTGQYVLVKKLAYDDYGYTDDGTVRGKRIKSTAFKSAKIVAPSGGSAEAVNAPPNAQNTREYLYCWIYQQSDGAWKRSGSSVSVSVADVQETDAVTLYGMAVEPPVAFPAGAKNIRKAVFRKDGAAAFRLVAKLPRYLNSYRDGKKTGKLGLPISHWALGISGAPSAPTAGVVGQDDVETISRVYVSTWVTVWGEESAPSAPSNVLDLKPWEEALVGTEIASPLPNITRKRIYRTDVTGTFRFATELDVSLGEWVDSLDDDDLGDPIETTLWSVPPDDLKGLVALPNGVLAGFRANQVLFSEVDAPYAWPVAYRYTVASNVVALAVIDGGVLVLTSGLPYLCRGFDPATAIPELQRERVPCVSARSVVDMGGWAMWATPDGLASTRGGSPQLETAGIFTRAQWQGFVPSSIVGGYWQGRYVAFWDTGFAPYQGSLIFDLAEGWMSRCDQAATAAWSDIGADQLYIAVGNNVQLWEGGSARTWTWKSGRMLLDAGITPLVARVDSSGYPISFKLYADGVLKHTQTVADSKAFRLPGGYRGFGFEVELSGTAQVRHAVVASTMEDLAG